MKVIQNIKNKITERPKVKKGLKIVKFICDLFAYGFTIFTILALAVSCNPRRQESNINAKPVLMEEKQSLSQLRDKDNQRVVLSMSYLLSYEGFKTIYSYCNNSNNYMYDLNNSATPLYILNNAGECDFFYTRTYNFSNDTYYMPNNQPPISIKRFGFRQFANQDFYSGSVSYNFYRFYMWTTTDTSGLAYLRFNYYVAPFMTELNHYQRNTGDLFYSSAEINNNGTFSFVDYTFNSYSVCSRFHNALYDAYLYYGNNNYNQQKTYDQGYEAGHSRGHIDGYNEGFDAGYDAGYDVGDSDGYTRGNTAGYQTGYNTGYDAGYDVGESVGYSQSMLEGDNSPFTLLQTAFTSIGGILNIEILPNFTLGLLIFVPLIVAVIIVIVKLIRG